MMPGFGELMRMESLKYVPTAVLSRQTAGIRGNSFIINSTWQSKIYKRVPRASISSHSLLHRFDRYSYIQTDENKMKVFRPKKK